MSENSPRLSLRDVRVRLDGAEVVRGVSLDVAAGERVVVLGPSGGGKTTLLRAIVGLEELSAGAVLVDGRDLAGLPPERRGIGMVFQDQALFTHRDVQGNVEFGLRMAGWPHPARRRRVDEVLALVGLGGFGPRTIEQLSGGERQRVALARALAPEPAVLLLDEPLGALDRSLRDHLVLELRDLFSSLDVKVVHVTHDQEEALALADRVAILRDGAFVQLGRPREVWGAPVDRSTARLLGFANLFPGHALSPWGLGHDGIVLVRPESVVIRSGSVDAGGVGGARPGRVVAVAFRGGPSTVVVAVDGIRLEAHVVFPDEVAEGDTVLVGIDPSGVVELGPA